MQAVLLGHIIMAKQEESIAIIRPGEYIEELEDKVKLEYARIMALPTPSEDPSKGGIAKPVTKKYKHTVRPDFGNDKKAQADWELNEIFKCIHGDGDIPGKYYYYLNHTKIKNKERGKINPDFRTMDLEWFKFLENIQKTKGKGIVCVKRRQVGMSWKSAADVMHDAQFNIGFDIGMNSKGISDSQQLLEKVRYVYRNQSDFLRVATSTDRRDKIVFAVYDKDEYGNRGKLIRGTESSILVVAPTVAGHSGNQYLKLICDEFGETEEGEGLFSNAEDCLIQDGVRVGTCILFGSMGDTDKAGKSLMQFWKNAHMYDMVRFPFWGYHELIMDEYGNDNLIESLRWIIYNRRKKENGSSKVYSKFIQKYPLNEQDAFLSITGFGVGNPLIIGQQKINLMNDPPERREGIMKMVGDKPEFQPHPGGHAILYELPQHGVKDSCTATLDPAEDDFVNKTKDSSDLGFSIVARAWGLMPPRLVARYCHRPQKLEDAYRQIAMMLMLYNTKLHIEMNKGGWRAYDWFTLNHPELLALSVKAANNLRSGVDLKHGVKMNQDKKLQMEGLLNQYIDNYCLPIPEVEYKGIPDEKLLDQFGVFGADGQDDDLAVSFGWNLIIQQSDKKIAQSSEAQAKPSSHSYKNVNGVIRLVTTATPQRRFTLPKHPLFNR